MPLLKTQVREAKKMYLIETKNTFDNTSTKTTYYTYSCQFTTACLQLILITKWKYRPFKIRQTFTRGITQSKNFTVLEYLKHQELRNSEHPKYLRSPHVQLNFGLCALIFLYNLSV